MTMTCGKPAAITRSSIASSRTCLLASSRLRMLRKPTDARRFIKQNGRRLSGAHQESSGFSSSPIVVR